MRHITSRSSCCILALSFVVAWRFLEPISVVGQEPSLDEIMRQFKLAQSLQAQGKYAEAAKLYEQFLPAVEVLFGKDNTNTGVLTGNLAGIYRELGQYAKAETLYQRALQIQERIHGKDSLEASYPLGGLGTLYFFKGQYEKAESLMVRALEITEAKLGKDHPHTAVSLNDLALLYEETGQSAKAESFHRRSLEIREAKLGKDHPDVAQSLDSLGGLYVSLHRYAQAEALFQRSLQIRETQLGKNHPATAHSLNSLAVLYRTLGQYAKAEPLLRRCVEIVEARYPNNHPLVGSALSNLASLHMDMGENAKAEPLLQRSLRIFEDLFGKNHERVARVLNDLAFVYSRAGDYAKAESLHTRNLRIHEALFGATHPNVAHTCHSLGGVYRNMGRHAQAETLFLRALRIWEATHGKHDPVVTNCLATLAHHAASQAEWTKATDYFQKARQGVAHHLAEALPLLAEKEQLQFQAKYNSWFHEALSLGYLAPEAAGAASAEWLLNAKGIIHQTLAEQHLLIRDAKAPEAKHLAAELKSIRAQLATLRNRQPLKKESEYLRQLQAKELDLAQKLARAVGRPARSDPWVSLNAVRAKLGAKAVLVDIARFPILDAKNRRKNPPRYVCWITPPAGQGKLEVVDLGDAGAIDDAVREVREVLNQSARDIAKQGEADAYKKLQDPLRNLAGKVLHPLMKHLAGYEEWIISPDGALWLVPWSALPLADGKHVLEKHAIRQVISGRDLVVQDLSVKASDAWVFADPDYDLAPAAVAAQAQSFLQGFASAALLTGARFKGTIGNWNVSFEFLDGGQVLIRDEDSGGKVAGQGAWSLNGGKLTMQTKYARFEGAFTGNKISGQRFMDSKADPWQLLLPKSPPAQVDLAEVRSAASASQVLPKVPRLPASAAEAALIEPSLKTLLQVKPKVLSEGMAAEAVVKAVARPRILMLSTHGYFLPDQKPEVKETDRFETLREHQPAVVFNEKDETLENPLLRCGLLLAGCNQRALAKMGEEDGILTGLEILGMDLRGCELVVLSACETGVGDVKNGEGVAGLRQAFMLAGAESVLASLWQVSDRETALLMGDFFSNLSKGQSNAQALRHAQLKRIEDRRERFGAAHPFFWAAFTVTGK